jgi:ABC-2 type transport system permease protein
MNSVRVFVVGGYTSYRALFNWISPWVFVPQMLGYPIFEILFFSYLGRFASTQSDKFFLIGNTFMAIAVTGFFGMGNAIGGEKRSQTLSTLLASPANRIALFLGRAVPSIFTGVVVASTAFAVCSTVLGARFSGHELAGLAAAGLASSFACTAFGMCIGSIGLRTRSVSIFADTIAGLMLFTSGANVPLHRLPGWIQAFSNVVPLTHGIEAGRVLGTGGSFSTAGHLLADEVIVGLVYLVLGLALLRWFEYASRRSAAIEAF